MEAFSSFPELEDKNHDVYVYTYEPNKPAIGGLIDKKPCAMYP